MNNNRPLSTRKTIQLLVIITILAGATQTMVKQLGTIGGAHMLLAGVLANESVPTLPRYHFEQGHPENTGNPLDVAIQGNGFFCVKLSSGIRPQFGYTRVGQFFVNNENQLVAVIGTEGYPLVPSITIPTGVKDIQIATDGTIVGVMAGNVDYSDLAQLHLACFSNPDGLREVQDDIYQPTTDSGQPFESNANQGKMLQHYLESLARN